MARRSAKILLTSFLLVGVFIAGASFIWTEGEPHKSPKKKRVRLKRFHENKTSKITEAATRRSRGRGGGAGSHQRFPMCSAGVVDVVSAVGIANVVGVVVVLGRLL